MISLYEDTHFTFRFADDRIIPRFHLEGVEAGRQVSVFKIIPTPANACACWRRQPWTRRLGGPGCADHRASGLRRLSSCKRDTNQPGKKVNVSDEIQPYVV